MFKLIRAHDKDLGGFSVRRALPTMGEKMVGPFIFLDHLGPAEFAPGEGIDVRPHPHIGLATVTYLFEGALLHRDSLGSVQRIEPEDVNWMTAGRGIAHSERSAPEDRAGVQRLHGIQTWVALPSDQEECAPAFTHIRAEELPRMLSPGIDVRVVAGQAFGRTAPTPCFSPMFYLVCRLAARTSFELPAEYEERAIYVVSGQVTIAEELVPAQHLAIITSRKTVYVDSPVPALVLMFGGAPIGDRLVWWNFTASRAELIDEAKRRWAAGEFAPVPAETEFIPLPDR